MVATLFFSTETDVEEVVFCGCSNFCNFCADSNLCLINSSSEGVDCEFWFASLFYDGIEEDIGDPLGENPKLSVFPFSLFAINAVALYTPLSENFCWLSCIAVSITI